MAFHDTLKARDRRLAGRMEGLGDVVVGFAMSQLVIELPQVGAAIHVRHAIQIDVVWQSALRNTAIAALMLLALIVDVTRGPGAAAVSFFLVVLSGVLIRMLFRKAPSAEFLRIPAQAAGG